MAEYVHSSKELLEASLTSGKIADSFILSSNIDYLQSCNVIWDKTDITDSNCNDSIFDVSQFSECKFHHSSFINTCFNKCSIKQTYFTGVSLIKSKFSNSFFNSNIIESCTMQRANLDKNIIQNTTLKNFEGVYTKITDTVFINCLFELTYGNGMNGFSSADIENCIFINCSFKGFPLRGTNVTRCTFINCNGEISDDITVSRSYGIPHIVPEYAKKLIHKEQALKLIYGVKNV